MIIIIIIIFQLFWNKEDAVLICKVECLTAQVLR
jgi:hypothetical protein